MDERHHTFRQFRILCCRCMDIGRVFQAESASMEIYQAGKRFLHSLRHIEGQAELFSVPCIDPYRSAFHPRQRSGQLHPPQALVCEPQRRARKEKTGHREFIQQPISSGQRIFPISPAAPRSCRQRACDAYMFFCGHFSSPPSSAGRLRRLKPLRLPFPRPFWFYFDGFPSFPEQTKPAAILFRPAAGVFFSAFCYFITGMTHTSCL